MVEDGELELMGSKIPALATVSYIFGSVAALEAVRHCWEESWGLETGAPRAVAMEVLTWQHGLLQCNGTLYVQGKKGNCFSPESSRPISSSGSFLRHNSRPGRKQDTDRRMSPAFRNELERHSRA